jgi:hypothetical protein
MTTNSGTATKHTKTLNVATSLLLTTRNGGEATVAPRANTTQLSLVTLDAAGDDGYISVTSDSEHVNIDESVDADGDLDEDFVGN